MICYKPTLASGVAEMSDAESGDSRPDWLCNRELSKERSDVGIGTQENAKGQVTFIDLDASNYMAERERWMTFETDRWVLDLEGCR